MENIQSLSRDERENWGLGKLWLVSRLNDKPFYFYIHAGFFLLLEISKLSYSNEESSFLTTWCVCVCMVGDRAEVSLGKRYSTAIQVKKNLKTQEG